MTDRSELASSRRRVRRVYVLALLFAFGLFLFHTLVLFEIAAVMMHAEAWLTELLGKHRYGKAIILGCFCFLFAGHVAEAAAWGLFLRWQRLVLTVSEGLYFAAVTITTLGYGDLILAHFFGCGHRFLHGDDVAILRESRGSICGEAVKASITAGFCKSLKATTLRTMRGGPGEVAASMTIMVTDLRRTGIATRPVVAGMVVVVGKICGAVIHAAGQ